MKGKKLCSMLLVFVMLFTFAGCSQQGDSSTSSGAESSGQTSADNTTSTGDEEEYVFSVIAPFTGPNAQYGEAYKRAIDLLVEQVNADGGINGGKVVVEYHDDKNDAKEAVSLATNVANDDRVLGCVGSQTSTPSMAMAPIFQKAGVTLISPQASHNDFAAIGDYIFRTIYLQSDISSAIAQGIYDMVGDEVDQIKAGLIYMNTDWGIGFNETVTKKLTELGGEVLIAETYVSGQTQDFTPLLTKIKNSDCNVLVLGSNYSEGGQLVKQAKMLGIDLPTFGSASMYKQEFIEIGGEDAEDAYVTTLFFADNQSPQYLAFKEAYTEKYGTEDPIDEYAVKGYDSMKILIEGAMEHGHDREGIRDYAAALENWEGVSGTLTMDEEGNPSGPLYLMQVKDGEFVMVQETVVS